MAQTTHQTRETSVGVQRQIPAGRTIADYRRAHRAPHQPAVRRWRLWRDPETRICALYES